MSRRTADETRAQIFAACSTILCQDGLAQLTLSAVAEAAALSKGGLLYHFPTKLSLVEALFTHHLDLFDAEVHHRFAADRSDAPGRWLRAYAEASIAQITDADTASLFASLFAAGERYPSVLEIMRQRYLVWQRQIDADNLSPAWALLWRMLVDGLWFTQLYQFSPPDEGLSSETFALLTALTLANNSPHSTAAEP